MPLPDRDLDNRKFQDIVDDVKEQIALRCPEWTDHNVSDPGVTLIELFASVMEQMLFQLNQVPDKNYIKFLDLIGVRLETPRPAVAELRYILSRVIDDTEQAETYGLRIPKDTIAATQRTETEQAVQFLTDKDLYMQRPRLAKVVAIPADVSDEDAKKDVPGVRIFELEDQARYIPVQRPGEKDLTFRVYGMEKEGIESKFDDSPSRRLGDRLCFGFEADISAWVIDLVLKCTTNRPSGLIPDYPNQVWEYWDGASDKPDWRPLELLLDAAGGFTKENGYVRLALPDGLLQKTLADFRGYWIRCRYTMNESELKPRPSVFGERTHYTKSPSIYSVRARTVGGTVLGTNCSRIYRELLGQSDGKAGQVFKTRFAPVHKLREDEVILSAPYGEKSDSPNWLEWTWVEDFAESGPNSRHFALDELTGEISFGPVIERPDGGPPDRHGMVPDKGHQLVLTSYRVGGGTVGNVREGRICIDKQSLAYVASVENPRPARNGRDTETMDHAAMKATKLLKTRNRAVTKEDYELIALEVHGVGRSCCLQPEHPTSYTNKAALPESERARVEVLIVPAIEVPIPQLHHLVVPKEFCDFVKAYLDERRLLTATLKVTEAKYVFVETEIIIVPDPRMEPDQVAERVRDSLNVFLHPLKGGPTGEGWPFGRELTFADLYPHLGQDIGVALLKELKITAHRAGYPSANIFAEGKEVEDLIVGLKLEPDEILCPLRHNIHLVPITVERMNARGAFR